ncbi:hypothetical protein ACWCQ1_32075 [Streptomyces sp. NPDC002144]
MNDLTFELAATADTIRTWLTEADRVLITAGAGLSAAAGYDYGDEDRFKELFPALHRLGLRSRYLRRRPSAARPAVGLLGRPHQ